MVFPTYGSSPEFVAQYKTVMNEYIGKVMQWNCQINKGLVLAAIHGTFPIMEWST